MSYPKLSISQSSTYTASFEEDLVAYKAAGVDGVGIWEYKLPKGQDERLREELLKSGLKATLCVPEVPSIVPDNFFREPVDAASRRKELCAAIRRLAAFDPLGVMVLPGAPQEGVDDKKTRQIVVEGLKAAAETAGEVGVPLGLELLRKEAGSIATTLPETIEMIEDIGTGNIEIIYDTWHTWDLPTWAEDTKKYVDRIIGVQINDWREPVRSWADRVLPGDGKMDLPMIFGTLEAAGYDGWFDVEVFSDCGLFGNDYADSLWKLSSAEFAKRAVKSFRETWDKRSTKPTK
jgi:sugar phosphate isomerase/epimerase